MAIFSSTQTAQTISAPPLPVLTEELPRIIFSGTDCRTVTVTLESTTTYKKNPHEDIKVRMLKIYTVNSATPQTINVEVKVEIFKNSQLWQPLATFFKLDIDPHLRNGQKRLNRDNPQFFVPQSAQVNPETSEWCYELYTLPVRRINPNLPTYLKPNALDRPTDHLEQYFVIVEFNKRTSSWTYVTLSSLLSDLLENCPPFFLQLYIVGNYQFNDITKARNREGGEFAFAPTGFTNPVEVEEAKWDQFLLARAQSMKAFIFGTRELDIKTLPAIKIVPGAGGTETVVWNDLANLFQLPDGSPDIPRLKQLNLEKGKFPAGSIFLWISLNLFDVEVLFQTDKAVVYPSSGSNWQNLSQNNLKKINKLRQALAFLVPSSVNNNFVTNITDVGLLVEGHTDTVASAQSNQKLSEDRAAAVIAELVTPTKPLPAGVTGGIDISKFNPQTGRGYGETRPCIPTPNPWDEERNRRVLIRVVSVVCPP